MIDLLSFLTKILGGFDVPEIGAKVDGWLQEKGEEYPDLKERTDALAVWIGATLKEASPELDPETMANTLKGIAADVVYGRAGVDRRAWSGGA